MVTTLEQVQSLLSTCQSGWVAGRRLTGRCAGGWPSIYHRACASLALPGASHPKQQQSGLVDCASTISKRRLSGYDGDSNYLNIAMVCRGLCARIIPAHPCAYTMITTNVPVRAAMSDAGHTDDAAKFKGHRQLHTNSTRSRLLKIREPAIIDNR